MARLHCALPFIIRGYELRGFVEDQTSEKRYEEIVAWFGLQPLLSIQRNLRALRRQVKQEAESTAKRQERLRDLPRITGNAVHAWDEPAVCQWFNDQVLARLDKALKITTLLKDDAGYLSDSQVHTLALSLRLAAIRLFNAGAPIIVLDDVVTSYDADNRKNIAAMLATHFADHQIIVVTHEERFFALLQDHLPQASWRFRRITELRPDFGPAFHDHCTPDEEIQAKLHAGQSAGNEIRQAEEEWLLGICRAFRVRVVIRPVDRPYKFDRSELAGALASFLKSAGIALPQVPGIANPFLVSLQKGDVENFSSHFSDNPNESASSGDEKTRWTEFTYFRDLFVCPNCSGNQFQRPEPLNKPVCKKCQTPFSFKEPASSRSD